MNGRETDRRSVERSIIARLLVANAIAGAVVTTYLVLAAHLPPGVSRVRNFAVIATIFTLGLVLMSVVAVRLARRLLLPPLSWVDERPPTSTEADLVLALPRRIATFQLPFWCVAALGTALGQLANPDPKPLFAFVGVLQGGFFAAAIGYLLAERLLRPYLAIALEHAAPSARSSVGVGPRLLLAWLVGSGIPLIVIVATPLVASDADLPVTVPMVFLAVAGFISGLLLTGAAARSIGEPLRAVRYGLQRVAAGELTTTVRVDDTGEVGELQRGFNQMVAGLRERERLADLFGRHVGLEVAQRALQEGAALGGETREISALFVDIIGSTTMARERSAPDVVALLNQFFAIVISCIDAEGGWVNKFEGDGALCVFGAPVSQDDHAARALRAARQIARSLHDIDAGIGVSSGEAVAGNVGAEQRFEYTIIGQPVNEAARLSDAAKTRPSRLVASATAVAASGDEAREWRAAGTLSLRGLAPDFSVCEPRS
jgi:adenylate cyclase